MSHELHELAEGVALAEAETGLGEHLGLAPGDGESYGSHILCITYTSPHKSDRIMPLPLQTPAHNTTHTPSPQYWSCA